MSIEDLQKICDQLPKVTTDIKWEDHLCFNVGDKMFLVTSPDHVPCTASFKTGDEEFEKLIAKEGVAPAAYLARHKWVKVDDIKLLSGEEWKHYINESYKLVASKLPAKIRRELKLSER